jgi:hypothetical protein
VTQRNLFAPSALNDKDNFYSSIVAFNDVFLEEPDIKFRQNKHRKTMLAEILHLAKLFEIQ